MVSWGIIIIDNYILFLYFYILFLY
jgi:hypothetical protein